MAPAPDLTARFLMNTTHRTAGTIATGRQRSHARLALRRPPAVGRWSRIAWPLLVGALACVLVAGCRASYRLHGSQHGGHGIIAAWQGRTLRAELPDAVRVPGAHAAAAQALLARGYSLEADELSADRGLLVARQPDGSMLGPVRRVVVRTALTPAQVGLTITLEPAGQEATARAIFDDVLARIGL